MATSSSAAAAAAPAAAPSASQAAPPALAPGKTATVCRALRLEKVLADPRRALPRIEDAVLRANRAMQIATVLLARETLRSLEAGEVVPALWKNSVVEQAIGAATAGYTPCTAANRLLHARFVAARVSCMPGVVLVDRSGLSSVLKDQAAQYAANALTSLKLHVGKRVARLMALRANLTGAAYAALTPEGHKERREGLKLAAADAVVAQYDPTRKAPAEFARLVDDVRETIGIDAWAWTSPKGAKRELLDAVEADPLPVLRAMYAINVELGAAGAAVFALVPVRTANVPRFVRIGDNALTELRLLDSDAGQATLRQRARKAAMATVTSPRLEAIEAELRSLQARAGRIQRRLRMLGPGDEEEERRLREEIFAVTGTAPNGSRRANPGAETTVLKAEREALISPGKAELKRVRESHKAEDERLKQRRIGEDLAIRARTRSGRTKAEAAEAADAKQSRKRQREAEIAALQARVDNEDVVGTASRQCKADAFAGVLVLPRDLQRVGEHRVRFADGLSTDGYSARLLLTKTLHDAPASSTAAPHNKKRKTPPELPKRGIIGVQVLSELVQAAGDSAAMLDDGAHRELSPREQNLELNEALGAAFGGTCPFRFVGCDPGKRELLVVADPDVFGVAPAERAEQLPNRPLSERYTSAQRRHDREPGRYGLRKSQRRAPGGAERVKHASLAAEYRVGVLATPADVLQAERSIVADAHATGGPVPCAKGPSVARLDAWIAAREAVRPTLAAHYEQLIQRKLRWKRHIEGERSTAMFVARLKAFETRTGKQLLLAYGGWGMSAGRPGQATNRHSPPCMGVGLLRELAAHFAVVIVPEPYTSKTCHFCGSDALRCKAVEEARIPERNAQADAALTKALAAAAGGADAEARARQRHARVVAHRPHVRGLRGCTNPECALRLNRDLNAAANIAINGKRLALGAGLFRVPTKRQDDLQAAQAALGR